MITTEQVFEMQSEILASINHINNGGCIHFAYFFSRALKAAKIPHKVCFFNYDPISLGYLSFESVSHVMIYIPNIGYIDGYHTYKSRKDYFKKYDEQYQKIVNISLVKLNYFRRTKSWNHTYPTRQNSLLSKIVNKHVQSWVT